MKKLDNNKLAKSFLAGCKTSQGVKLPTKQRAGNSMQNKAYDRLICNKLTKGLYSIEGRCLVCS